MRIRAAAAGPAASFAIGLALRVHLVWTWPAVHGGDSVGRLAHSDRLLLAYQLPLPQALVFVVRHLAPDPLWTRLAFAIVGAGVAAAVAALVGEVAGRRAGLVAGLLVATHPLLVYYSIVPYQEGPMLLLIGLGALALLRGRTRLAAVVLGLACLCRYEAWIAAGLAAAAVAWRERARPGAALSWALAFAAVPLLWVLGWGGLSPPGTYVLDRGPAAVPLRAAFLFAKVREYSGLPLFACALVGLVVMARQRRAAWAWGLAFVAALLSLVLVAGHEAPPGSGQISERLAHVPAVATCVAAAVALDGLASAFRRRRLQMSASAGVAVFAVSIAVSGGMRARDLVAEANRDASLRLAWAVAQHAAAHLPEGGRLAVVAPATDPALVRAYLEKVAATGGDITRAKAWIALLGARPPDADRIAAQLPRAPAAVVAKGPADLVAIYDDAPGTSPAPPGEPQARFTAGARGVTVYALR